MAKQDKYDILLHSRMFCNYVWWMYWVVVLVVVMVNVTGCRGSDGGGLCVCVHVQ